MNDRLKQRKEINESLNNVLWSVKKDEKQSNYSKKEVKFKGENQNKNANIPISVNDSNAHRIKRVRMMGSYRNNNLNKISINKTEKKIIKNWEIN